MKTFSSRLCAAVLIGALFVSAPASALATEAAPSEDTQFEASEADTAAPALPEEGVAPLEETPADEVPAEAPPTDDSTVLPVLTGEHVQYMVGFTDGTMRPNKSLSRAEAAALIHRLLASPDAGTNPVTFTDIRDVDWFATPVLALARLGMLGSDTVFRPKDAITRAEFVDILVHLAPDAQGNSHFTDVPENHWAYESIGKAVALGWISGFPDGSFGPERTLSRAEACAILNRITGRSGDSARAHKLLALGLYKDIHSTHWAGTTICEATIAHTASGMMESESWDSLNYESFRFTPGVKNISGILYAVDRNGTLIRNRAAGAYMADMEGRLTAVSNSYQSDVPYISMLDGLGATVGCEPISALMGLRAKGFATTTSARTFLAMLPKSQSNPEYGFVGSPYHHDGRYSSINPRPLASYCNSYCGGSTACADFCGASIDKLRQELLCGNLIVAYQTYWWQPIRYGSFIIDGKWQSMVANNHVRLIAGYDPSLGYYVSDPYNPQCPGQAYQYWIDAQTFEKLWNQRKMGMVIR